MPLPLNFQSIAELSRQLREKKLSPVDLVESCFQRIHKRQSEVRAFITLLEKEALQLAKEQERRLAKGEGPFGPLFGIPIAIKDISDEKRGVRCTSGLKLLEHNVSQRTSLPVRLMEEAGAIVIGKTNTPEFGYKGITDNLLVGPTSTPYAIGHNAGGSSGGSAAAVADGMCTVAHGNDGGGSVRIPAAWCHCFGYKATFGRNPFDAGGIGYFHTPFVFTGPITRTVGDAAVMMQVLAVYEPLQPFSLPSDGTNYTEAMQQSIRGRKIAYAPHFGDFPLDPEVKRIVTEAVNAFEEAGAIVEEVDLDFGYSHEELGTLWQEEISVLQQLLVGQLRRAGVDLLSRPDLLPPDLVANIERGGKISAVAYRQGDLKRIAVHNELQRLFSTYDWIACPTLAVPPVLNRTDGNTVGPSEVDGERVDPLIGWCLTYPINFTGHPACSLPAGLTREGLPVGMQLVGRWYEDGLLFAASAAYEKARPWFHTYPGLMESLH